MNLLTIIMIGSFVILFFLWISYFLLKDSPPKIPFAYWCFTQIYCFIAILGVGMMQAHLDCMSLWGDCYAHHYPGWLHSYKPLLLNSITIWAILAVGAIVINMFSWYRRNR